MIVAADLFQHSDSENNIAKQSLFENPKFLLVLNDFVFLFKINPPFSKEVSLLM